LIGGFTDKKSLQDHSLINMWFLGAWPVLIDDFVEYSRPRLQQQQKRQTAV
jgi:hypothetical protein